MDYPQGQQPNPMPNYSRQIQVDDESKTDSIHLESFDPDREPRKGENRTIYNVVDDGAPQVRSSSYAPADSGTFLDQNSSSAFHNYRRSGYPQDDSQTYGQATSKYFTKFDGSGRTTIGRWTKEEHEKFLEALKIYGKEWSKVQEVIKTRSSGQIRSHAQKFFDQLKKKGGEISIMNTKKNVVEVIRFSPNSGDDPRLAEQTRVAQQKNLYKFESQQKKLQLNSPTQSQDSFSDNDRHGEKSEERLQHGFTYKKKAPPANLVIHNDEAQAPISAFPLAQPQQAHLQNQQLKVTGLPHQHEMPPFGVGASMMRTAPNDVRINNHFQEAQLPRQKPEQPPEKKNQGKTLDLRHRAREANMPRLRDSGSSHGMSQLSKKIKKKEGFNQKEFLKVQRLRNTDLSASEKSDSNTQPHLDSLTGALAEEAERLYKQIDPNPSVVKRFNYQLHILLEQKERTFKQSQIHMKEVHHYLKRINDLVKSHQGQEPKDADELMMDSTRHLADYKLIIEQASKDFTRGRTDSIKHFLEDNTGPFKDAELVQFAQEQKKYIEDLNILIIKRKEILELSQALSTSLQRVPQGSISPKDRIFLSDIMQENNLLSLELMIQKMLLNTLYMDLMLLFDKFLASCIPEISCIGPKAQTYVLPVSEQGVQYIKQRMDKPPPQPQQQLQIVPQQPSYAQIVPATNLVPIGEQSQQQPFHQKKSAMMLDHNGYVFGSSTVQPIYAASLDTGSLQQYHPNMQLNQKHVVVQQKIDGHQLSRFSLHQGQHMGLNGTPPESDNNQMEMLKNNFQIGDIDAQSRQTGQGQINKFGALMQQPQSNLPRKGLNLQNPTFKDASSRIQTSGSQAANHISINAFQMAKQHLPTAAPQTRQYASMIGLTQISHGPGIHMLQSTASENGLQATVSQSANPIQRQVTTPNRTVIFGQAPSQGKPSTFLNNNNNKVSAQNSSVQMIPKGHGESNSVTAGFPHNQNSNDFRGGGGHSSFGVQQQDGQSMNSRRDLQLQANSFIVGGGQSAFGKAHYEKK